MTNSLEVPKSNPADIAKIAVDGIESGSFEIIADDDSRKIQSGLAGAFLHYTHIFLNDNFDANNLKRSVQNGQIVE